MWKTHSTKVEGYELLRVYVQYCAHSNRKQPAARPEIQRGQPRNLAQDVVTVRLSLNFIIEC
jgi:hypothetical protein